MDLISIIIPIYNVEKYLPKCIKSTINQTYTNLEIILIDDGSTDNCPKICDYYLSKDLRIKVIHKSNSGLSDARNLGLKNATGKYVFFLDSDDFIEPQTIEHLYNLMKQDDDLDIIFFEYNYFYEKGDMSYITNMNLPTTFNLSSRPDILFKSVSAHNKMYNMNFLKKIGLSFPSNRLCEDLYTIPCIYPLAKKMMYINEPLYNYLQREGSIIRSKKFVKLYEDRKYAINHVFEFYRSLSLEKKYENELTFLKYYHGVYYPIIEVIKNNGENIYIKNISTENKELMKDIKKNKYFKCMEYKKKFISYVIFYRLFLILRIIYKFKKS